MELELYKYTRGQGWDREPDAALDSADTLLLFFAAADRRDVEDPLVDLCARFPLATIMGCSGSGEIFGENLFDHGISLAVVNFRESRLRYASCELAADLDSAAAGAKLADELRQDGLRAVMVLSDGLLVNGSRLVEGLSATLPQGVVITGGLAGDGDRFEHTWVWIDGQAREGFVSAVGFYGDALGVGHGSRGGWDVLGPEREVTRAEDNVLYTLDGQPALQLYKKYLGERAEGLPATGLLFPLAISNDDRNDGDTVRTILAVNEDRQSITFAGDIPEGSYVRLMRANFDRLIDGAVDASAAIDVSGYHEGPLLSVAISCVGRRLVLGQRTEEEIEAALEGLPEGARQIGYYSYGEISPLASGRCDLHNQTMTLTLLWEN